MKETTRQGDSYGWDRCCSCLMSLSLACCSESKTRKLKDFDGLSKQLIVIIVNGNNNFVYFHSTSPHLLSTDCQERDTQRRPANCCSFDTPRKHKPLLKIKGYTRPTLWLSSLGETYSMCLVGAHRAESELGTSKKLSWESRALSECFRHTLCSLSLLWVLRMPWSWKDRGTTPEELERRNWLEMPALFARHFTSPWLHSPQVCFLSQRHWVR